MIYFRESKLDLTDTIKDGARLFLLDEGIRRKLILALTEDSKLHVEEVCTQSNICSIIAVIVSLTLGASKDKAVTVPFDISACGRIQIG